MFDFQKWTYFQKVAYPAAYLLFGLMVIKGIEVLGLVEYSETVSDFASRALGMTGFYMLGLALAKIQIERDLGKEL